MSCYKCDNSPGGICVEHQSHRDMRAEELAEHRREGDGYEMSEHEDWSWPPDMPY